MGIQLARYFIGLLLLVIPGFFVRGLILDAVMESHEMESWSSVPGEVLSTDFELRRYSSQEKDSSVRYAFEYGGESIEGSRVFVSDLSSKVGGELLEVANRLRAAKAGDEELTIYVNPDDPSQHVLVRTISLWTYALALSLLLFFAAPGLFMLYLAVLLGPDDSEEAAAMLEQFPEEPWKQKKEWRDNPLQFQFEGQARTSGLALILVSVVGFPMGSVFFNRYLVSGSSPEGVFTLAILLFEVCVLAQYVVRKSASIRWRKSKLYLDPFPGVLRGEVSGWIDLPRSYRSQEQYTLSLIHLRQHLVTKDKKKYWVDTHLWDDVQKIESQRGELGTRISFRFDLPSNIRNSSDLCREEDSFYTWRLHLDAELPGLNIQTSCDIPVFDCGEGLELTAEELSESEPRPEPESEFRERASVSGVFEVRARDSDASIYFPMGRDAISAVLVGVVGLALLGAGAFAWRIGMYGPSMFLFFFGPYITCVSIYAALSSLEIHREENALIATRKFLGLTVQRKILPLKSLELIEKEIGTTRSSSGGGTVYFTLVATDISGDRVTLSERLDGESQANAAIERYCEVLLLDDELLERSTSTPASKAAA